jgi:hypothetical protein
MFYDIDERAQERVSDEIAAFLRDMAAFLRWCGTRKFSDGGLLIF